MTKNQIKELVEKSYDTGNLDETRVEKIAGLLKRSELKLYIKALKNAQKKRSVAIFLPLPPTKEIEQQIHAMYPKKEITYIIDPSLIVGLKIVDYDMITEYNLKHTLENIFNHITQENDQ